MKELLDSKVISCVLYTLLAIFPIEIYAQGITFTKMIGGPKYDAGRAVRQTFDGGYIISGSTTSFLSLPGPDDIYLIKTNELGDTIWTKTYGSPYRDLCYSVQQTFDTGYILAGTMGKPDTIGQGLANVWVLKTNALGDTLWTKSWGGNLGDYGYCVQQTTDSGYIVAGVLNHALFGGSSVGFLTKLSPTGDSLWTKTYGNYSAALSVQQTTDGCYIVTGYTNYNNPVSQNSDIYVVKTDSIGDTLWTETIDLGPYYDIGYSIIESSDNNYVITGSGTAGGTGSVYLCKLNSLNGNTIWAKTYGGNQDDVGRSVYQVANGGYIIVGITNSFAMGQFTNADVWLIKTDTMGDTLWTTTFGSTGNDEGYSGQQCTDGGYIIVGRTDSIVANLTDIFIIKTNNMGSSVIGLSEKEIEQSKISIYPNPTNGIITVKIESIEFQDIVISIVDMEGKTIFSNTSKLNPGKQIKEINISGYRKGTYLIRVIMSNMSTIRKIVIQ